jgi:hypothetical protein
VDRRITLASVLQKLTEYTDKMFVRNALSVIIYFCVLGLVKIKLYKVWKNRYIKMYPLSKIRMYLYIKWLYP